MYTIIATDQYDAFGTLDYLRDNSTGTIVVAVYIDHQSDIKAPEFKGAAVILCTPGSFAYIFGDARDPEKTARNWDIYDHWESYAAYCQWLNRNTMPTL